MLNDIKQHGIDNVIQIRISYFKGKVKFLFSRVSHTLANITMVQLHVTKSCIAITVLELNMQLLQMTLQWMFRTHYIPSVSATV
jgi:hypothetical protein